MSAADRLRALDEAMHFDTPTDRATFVAGRNATHSVLRALPELIALVGEAERQVAEAHPDDVDLELAAALAALNEKLGGET